VKILDRYVMKELVTPFLIGLFVFTFLLLIDKIFDLIDLIINKGVPVHLVLLLLAYILPAFLVLTIPIGFLLAILVAFGRLSGDMEIVALKASGVSPLRLLRPVLVFATASALVTAWLMMEAVPRSNYAFKSLIYDILRTQAAVGIKERVFNDTFGNFVIYVDEMASDQVALKHVFVSDERKPDELRVITAREGRLINDDASHRVTLRLLNGSIHETTPQALQKYRQVNFRLYDITLVLENPLVKQGEASKGGREMTIPELRQSVAAAIQSNVNPNSFIVEIHKKFAIPTACFVFAVLGVPLGIRAHRAGRWAAFVALLPVVLFYYVFLTLGEQMANTRRIPPWVAMWGPNIVVAVIGLYLLWSNLKERPIPVVIAAKRLFWMTADLVKALRSLGGRRLARREALRRRRLAPALRGARRRAASPLPRRVRAAVGIVNRHLSREFLTLFLYGLALATVMVVVGDLMTTLDRYLRLRPPLVFILEHFLYRTPPFVYQGLHIVVLMSTILLFLGLSRSNELTALKAGGMSLYRVSLPIFALAGLVTLGALGFQERLLPTLNQRAVEVDEAKIKRRTLPQLQKRTQIWYRGQDDRSGESRIYHIDLLDPASRDMNGVSILALDGDFGMRRRWDAKVMAWSDASESWRLRGGMRRDFEVGQADRIQEFRETMVRLPERFQDFAQIPRAPDVMNYVELRDYIGRLQQAGHQVGKYLVDLYSKLAFPLAAPVMVLVGIPFALQSPRGGRVIGIALCLALGLGYFVVHSAAVALARTDLLPPIVAAWSANFLFATLGLFLYLRART
jgi:LPS export ABC transporter permease LptF/LPS export ABC transporter permease LptG